MATIGSVNVAFTSEISGFQSGVDSVVSSLSGLSKQVDSLTKKLSSVSALSVSITVDSSQIEAARQSLNSLSDSASISITADSDDIVSTRAAVEDLSDSISATSSAAVQVDTEAAQASVSRLSAFLGVLSGAASSPAESVSELADATRGMAENARAMAESARFGGEELARFANSSDALANRSEAVANVSSTTSRAVTGSASAASGAAAAIRGWTTEYVSFEAAVDRTLAAAGRSRGAFMALSAAISTVSVSLGGTSTLMAAFGGSAAAAAMSFGALAGGAAGAVSSLATYAATMGLVRSLTVNMSEESQRFADSLATLAAATLATGVGLAASASTYSAVAMAIWSSTSASAAASAAFTSLAASTAALVTVAAPVVSSLNLIYQGMRLVSFASNENATGSGFAALTSEIAASTAVFGAATGAIEGLATGTGLMAGAMGGAYSALSGFLSAFPAFIALSVTASVAFADMSSAAVRFRVHLGQSAQELGNLADRFDSSVQQMEIFRIAANNSGVALGAVTRAQQNFYSSLSKVKIGQLGTDKAREAKAAFDLLGVSAERLADSSPEQVFAEVGKRLTELDDPARKAQVAMDLFGRTGPMILPMLKSLESLTEDMGRLGGTISDLDYRRFTDMNTSFDRLRTASGALADDLAIPFTRMQEAMNNAGAEVRGGFAPLVGAISEMIADVSTPIAVFIEIFGRITGTVLRVGAAIVKMIAVFQPFATIAAVAEIIGDRFNDMWSYIESAVEAFEEFASAVEETLGDSVESVMAVGEALTRVLNIFTNLAGLGDIFGGVTTSILAVVGAITWMVASTQIWNGVMATTAGRAIASAVITAASWVAAAAGISVAVVGVAAAFAVGLVAAMISAAATAVSTAAVMHVSWLFALGPIGLIIGAVELLVAGLAILYAAGSGIVDFFSGWGEGTEKIDGATASVEQLAEAAAANQAAEEPGFLKDIEAVGQAAGATQADIEAMKAAARSLASDMGFEIPEPVGFSAIVASIEEARGEFGDLSIRAAKFGQAGADAAAKTSERFNELQRSLADGKITTAEFAEESSRLSKELSESLDQIAKSSPEETLKRNLELFKELDGAAKQAAKSARDISAGVQIGDTFFPRSEEVKARAKQYAGEYSQALDEIKKKLASGGFQQELDARRSQNQQDFESKKISREEFVRVRAELDSTSAQEQASLAAEDVQRELDRKNALIKIDLDFADDIRKKLEDAFLSPVQKMEKELAKVARNPELSQADKFRANQMIKSDAREQLVGKSAQAELSDRRRDLSEGKNSGLITAEEEAYQLGKAMDDFASSVGATKTPFQEFASRSADIAKQFGMTGQPLEEVRKKLAGNAEQLALFDSAVKNSRDALLQSLGVPVDMREQFAQRQSQIDEAFADDPAKKAIAENALAIDRRKAAGLEATPAQQLAAGEAQVMASGLDGAELQEALKKNRDAILESVGVEKTGAQQFAETRDKLNKAVQDGVITQDEANKAIRKSKDELLASLGISKSPAEQFEDAVSKIQENAAALSPDEIAKGLKEAKDKLLSALGIDKSPAQAATESLQKLREAFNKGQISAEEFAKGSQKAKDTLLQSLGIPLDPVTQLASRMSDLQEAFDAGLISSEEFAKGQEEAKRSMLPGGEAKSPVKQFQEDIDAVGRAVEQGLISEEDGAARKANLQAQLQEDLKPALDNVAQDRRQIDTSDVRSKSGVDTFFRILRGNDNPSLKAQLEIARNTRLLAEAQQDPDAAPVIAQLSAK